MKHLIPPSGRRTRQALLLSALLAASAGAQAAGTASDTDISNIARLSYSVGGTTQGDICSSDTGNSAADTDGTCDNNTGKTTFKVDNMVNLSLIENGSAATSVAAGAQNQVTSFTLTNTGNTAQGYNLSAANVGSTVFAAADAFEVSNFEIYVDADNDGVLDAAEVTAGAIASYPSLAAGDSVSLLVVADIPAGQANNTQAAISLTAVTTTVNTTTPVVQSSSNDPLVVDIVFADAATTASGTDPGQVARDAQAVALDAYLVQTAQLTVKKVVAVVCDPVNGNGTPFNIPGAVVRWTLSIENTGSAPAILSTVADALNANTTFDPDLITGDPDPTKCEYAAAGNGVAESGTNGNGVKITVTNTRAMAGSAAGADTTSFYTGTADTDGVTVSGTVGSESLAIDFATALPAGGTYGAGELKEGETVTVYFNVGIN